MTPKAKKYAITLLVKHGLMADKDELVMRYTNNRTTHLGEMTYQESKVLIDALKGASPRTNTTNKILSMAHDMGWELDDGSVDMDRINSWFMKYTPLHVPMDDLPDAELGKATALFKKVHMSFMSNL